MVRQTTEQLCSRIASGDLRALAQAATLVEAQGEAGRSLISALFPQTGRGKIIGITGPPGAGKSTLVDQMIKSLRKHGNTVGVIAVDPSSPFTRGAILGDRIRMGDHYADGGVFIRSMATRGQLGGLAQATFEMALLLDAAGRDFVLIETVGVGQDEVDIARMADLTVVVLAPGMGDHMQAIKAGMMEIAGVFAINKADLPGADTLEQDIRFVQQLSGGKEHAKETPLCRIAALHGQGIDELMVAMNEVLEQKSNSTLRNKLWSHRLRHMLQDRIARSVPGESVERWAAKIAAKTEDPYTATEALMEEILNRRPE